MALNKFERRKALKLYVQENPFATDDQLAERFGVSVATIRLDRTALNIPEARERIRQVATKHHDAIRALEQSEVVGDIVELKLNRYAVSEFKATAAHVFSRTKIVRGHHLFAQVNSLATAVMDADVAVTAKTELRFYRVAYLGETLRSRVDVVAVRGPVAKCRVETTSEAGKVLDGVIWVVTEPSGVYEFSSKEWKDENRR
jgi:acyl-coenzyme A thioesterase PaaI-like protein